MSVLDSPVVIQPIWHTSGSWLESRLLRLDFSPPVTNWHPTYVNIPENLLHAFLLYYVQFQYECLKEGKYVTRCVGH